MLVNKIYYAIKPLIPRRAQIMVRRLLAKFRLRRHRDIWPIDPKSVKPPVGWAGWPDRKKFALILTHDVETALGHERCRHLMSMEEQMGFRSSFNFVPERYAVSEKLRSELTQRGFEIGVHGLCHDGKYYQSREIFNARAKKINGYLEQWQAVGFRSPSMLRNLDWIHDLNIVYDASTFDTDPFEPQSDGVGTIFPLWIVGRNAKKGYVELPYTLPQDFTLFIIFGERTVDIWKRKIDWIAANGGMALINVHPDYLNFGPNKCGITEYPSECYRQILSYIKDKYENHYWHVLPREIAAFWREKYSGDEHRL
jgi:hypothetical protein